MKNILSSLLGVSLIFTATLRAADAPAGNLFPEGNFSQPVDATTGAPGGWKLEPGDWKNKGGSLNAEVSSEEGNNYMHLASKSEDASIVFRLVADVPMPDPAPASLRISFRIRAVIDKVSNSNDWASVQLQGYFKNAAGDTIKDLNGLVRLKASTAGWEEKEAVVEVPDGAKTLELLPGLYLVKGTMDISDFSVTPE